MGRTTYWLPHSPMATSILMARLSCTTCRRLAMIGILIAAANETKYSETVLQQFQHTPFRTLVFTAIVVYSSLTPILKGAKSEAFGKTAMPQSPLYVLLCSLTMCSQLTCLMQVFSHPGLRSPTREQPCWALQHCYSLKTSLRCPFSDCKARGQQVGHWSNTNSHWEGPAVLLWCLRLLP